MKVSTYKLIWYIYFLTAIVSFTKLTTLFSLLPYLKYIQLSLIVFLVLIRVTQSWKVTTKGLAAGTMVIAFAVANLKYTSDLSILFYIVFVASMTFDNTDSFLRTDIKVRFSFLFVVVGLCLLGVLENYTMMRPDGSVRHSLGFNHPNMLGAYCIVILLEFLAIRLGEKLRMRDIFLLLLSILLVHYMSNSRTYILTLLLVLVISDIIYRTKLNNKVTNVLLILLPVILTVLSFVLAISFKRGNPMWEKLDMLVSNRISFAQPFLMTHNLQAFGQNIELVGSVHAMLINSNTHILDMGYLRFVLENGVILWGVLMVVLIVCMRQAIRFKNYRDIILMLFLMISAVFESTLSNPILNFIIPIVAASAAKEAWTRKKKNPDGRIEEIK